jgi:hypothetical protein
MKHPSHDIANHRRDFSYKSSFNPSELSRVKLLYFGIISVGFHEIDFSPSESSRWDFTRLIFHLRNHLGGISRD